MRARRVEEPTAFAREHLPSFAGEIRRRRARVERSEVLRRRTANIEVSEGIAATVRWLREREVLEA